MVVERKWVCKCGEFQIKLQGEPYIVFNCHCHSCTASARYVDVKGGGTSAIADPSTNSGAAKAFYWLSDVDVVDDVKLSFIKVGEKGRIVRSYTKCCNTMLNTASGKKFPAGFRPFNRNCIQNADGTQYNPPNVLNGMAKNAFDPATVPAPKVAGLPLCGTKASLCKFVTGICYMKCGCCPSGIGKNTGEAFWKDPREVTEMVPITWEPEATSIERDESDAM
jgi:hypothetical protein